LVHLLTRVAQGDAQLAASSVGRAHPCKENPGLFSSSGDQQEQPFVQVNADRGIWIK
jgi:hypothetical protein